MDRFLGMRAFVAVATQESFANAARELQMSRPSISRLVAQLEEALGVALLVRTTRSVRLTEVGSRYLEDARRILAEVEEAERSVAGEQMQPRGTLRVTAPVLFGRMHVLPELAHFREQHRALRVDVALLDRVTHLLEEGFDLGVRIAQLDDSGLRATRVGMVRRLLVASPAFLERSGAPQSVGDLENFDVIARTPRWRFRAGSVGLSPAFLSNDVEACISLARAGFGITQALSYQVGNDLAAGRLVTVLDDEAGEPIPVQLVRAGGQRAPAKVRAFLDEVVPRLRELASSGWIQGRPLGDSAN